MRIPFARSVTARERPDVALVGLGESSDHALQLVEKIVHEAACPVIALIHAPDPDFVKEASKRGVFAYITDADAKDWQSSEISVIPLMLPRTT
jgi:AmiR/NasT family two-component response regulator